MARTAQDALDRAADRAKRRAELETARLIVERNLGHDLADGEFGWCSVLSMPYLMMFQFIRKLSKHDKHINRKLTTIPDNNGTTPESCIICE